ncbi:hypothetical protein AAF712_010786 [Marasmius tenuissimus]|uniref:Uncharacterized protein n=1 Tax=Marasmius tenuissimus TaxID=585030 RepID=A0ABR2ZMA2_9AGAR
MNHARGPLHCGVCGWKERLMGEKSWNIWKDLSRLVLRLPRPYQWYFFGHEWSPESKGQDSCMIMGEKGIRFLIVPSIISGGFFFGDPRDLLPGLHSDGWLVQAGSILSHLAVPREKWSSSAIFTGFTLLLCSDAKEEIDDWSEELSLPCYLFLPPPPQLPNGAPDIETWLRGENLYYYSYDPEGGSVIAEQEYIALGLPSYTSEAYVDYAYWEADAYDFMEQWQKAKGFDYSTSDYAESLGFKIFKGIPEDELRFEDLVGLHSEEVLADNLMDVDSDIGNTSNHYDSSSEVEMDVDG